MAAAQFQNGQWCNSIWKPGRTKDGSMEEQQIRCKRCNEPIGVIIQIGGLQNLVVGNLVVYTLTGACAACGEPFYDSAGARKLAELVARVKQLRELT
jgi:hypothetical protein